MTKLHQQQRTNGYNRDVVTTARGPATAMIIGGILLLFQKSMNSVEAFSLLPAQNHHRVASSSSEIYSSTARSTAAEVEEVAAAAAVPMTGRTVGENGRDGLGDAAAAADESSSSTTTTLGNLQVPTVGIGTISWSSDSLWGYENDELEELVRTATTSTKVPAFFDTAERYGSTWKAALGMGWGETENLLRNLIDKTQVQDEQQQQPHPKPIIATKFTPAPWRDSVESVVEACEESRRRLGVDQIDLYQLHMPDIVHGPFTDDPNKRPKDEIYWNGLVECYNRGLVKNVGVCNYGPSLLMKCQEKLAQKNVPLASNQIAYSLIGRHNGAQQLVDLCNDELGIKVLAFFPYAMGLLTGKYHQNHNQHSSNAALSLGPSSQHSSSLLKSKKTALENRDLYSYAKNMTPLIKVMSDVATRHSKSISNVALNYIICKGAIPIPGARTQAQLDDSMGGMGWKLSPEEIQALESASDSIQDFDGFEGAGFKRTSEKFVGYGVEKWSLLD